LAQRLAELGAVSGEGVLHAWLKLPETTASLVAIAAQERFDHAVARVLGLGEAPDDRIVILHVSALTEAGSEAFPRFDWAALFADAERAVDARVEAAIGAAARAFDRGAWDEAARSYFAAAELLAHEATPRHAEVLAELGQLSHQRGAVQEARALFDRALSIFPVHQGALRARAAIASATGESAVAAAMLHRLVGAVDDPSHRVRMLSTIASESLSAARDAIVKALALYPSDPTLLERLRAVHLAAGHHADAVAVAVELAETVQDRAERARALVSAADLCADKLGDTARAVALYEAAIEDDPTIERAFSAIETVLLKAEDFAGVASAYFRQLARLEAAGAVDAGVVLYKKLAAVERDRLRNAPAAVSALSRVTELRPEDAAARGELAALYETTGDVASAIRCLEVSAQYDPLEPETYRRLYGLFGKSGDRDRAYSACGALVALGAADIDEQLIHAQFAPEAPLNPTRRFDADVWQALAAPGNDPHLEAVLAAIEPAAIAAWLAARPADAQPVLQDKKHRQDSKKTTVSAVRTFFWASRLLGVPEPTIYARPDDTRLGVVSPPVEGATVSLGRSVLVGRSPSELSFIAAHHMAYHRRGWRLLGYYSETAELEALIGGALVLGESDRAAALRSDARARELARTLGELVTPEAREALVEAAARFRGDARALALVAFRRSVETVACRAALLASGDVTVAGAVLAVSGAHVAGLTAADRTHDLLAFSVSERYAALRRRLGVAVA
jgi:tetratricopeptide (TPR) repeat protein